MLWSVPIGVRIDDEQGNFVGVIKALPLIREIVREAELTTKKYETTEIKLLTSEGRLIYSTKTFIIFEDLAQSSFFKKITEKEGFFI